MSTARILCGDVREVLPGLPAESVQCVVTSPPYWGLRDYGHEKQLGSERTYPEYVENMVAVFREVRRILRDDGTLWLNLGDCYATGAGAVGDHPGGGAQGQRWRGGHEDPKRLRDGIPVGPMTQPNRLPQPGLKAKDLVGIPWRVALALQADGWWLRSDVIWHKPNAMPSSVTDRLTMAHEYLFLMTKSERYFYDQDAIAEAVSDPARASRAEGQTAFIGQAQIRPRGPKRSGNKERKYGADRDRPGSHLGAGIPWEGTTRNKRSVWTIATEASPHEHFAVMPEALAEPCILAGSAGGGLVLDPFAGSGTVGVVALKHGREFLGVELNPEYAAMARERILGDAPLLNRAEVGT